MTIKKTKEGTDGDFELKRLGMVAILPKRGQKWLQLSLMHRGEVMNTIGMHPREAKVLRNFLNRLPL